MYEIRVLTDEEFDMLPYAHAKDALGLADAKRNVAFVRHTGIKDLDTTTINHEFDELLQKISPHEEDGIRYKKGKNIFKNIARIFLSTFVPPIGTIASAAYTAHDISKRGFKPSDLLSLAPPALGAFQGFRTGGLGGALKGAVGLTSASPTLSDPSTSSALRSSVQFGRSNAANAAKVAGSSFSNPKILTTSVPGGFGNFVNTARRRSTLNVKPPTVLDQFKTGLKKVGKNLGSEVIGSKITPQQARPLSNVGTAGIGAQRTSVQNFAPSLLEKEAQAKYITDDDVIKAFNNIDVNTALRTRGIKQKFRGQSREGNTAFNRALNNIATSRTREREQFLSEATKINKERHLKRIRADIMSLNNLTDAQFDEYVRKARLPGASANLKKVFAAFI